MQVFSLNPNLLEYEMQKAGFNPSTIAEFIRKETRRYLKIRALPAALLESLEKIFAASDIAVVAYQDPAGTNNLTNMIITGSDSDLISVIDLLKRSGPEMALIGKQLTNRFDRLRKPLTDGLQLGKKTIQLGKKTCVMGILNVTPDSFSDGGKFDCFESAVEHAFQMAEEGADIIDIGGESTRPGHQAVPAEEEINRVIPIIKALKKDPSFKLPLSIDTYKASVAEAALAGGVEMLNDVWGLKADPDLAAVAARYRVPVCLMHNRKNTDYRDLMADILGELEESVNLALQAGIDEDKIIVDPGIGFGKDLKQNLEVMLHLGDFNNLGFPLLLGTSRKSMIGKTLDLPVEERIEGTAATVAFGISAGADIVRVHDVKEMRRVADMTDAIFRR
jgi:dihydropteroate synthase